MKRVAIEIVKSKPRKLGKVQWHARVKGRNGEIVWTTELYERRASAKKACLLLLNLTLDYERDGFDIKELDETK